MWKSRKLRWRSRKMDKVERRLFETISTGLLRELTAEGELPPRSLETVARRYSSGSAESGRRAN